MRIDHRGHRGRGGSAPTTGRQESLLAPARPRRAPSVSSVPSVVHLLFALLTLALGCRRDGDGEEGEIEATGTVEVVEVDVAAPVPARVAEVRAREGDVVRRGDTLAMLTQPTLRADIE